MAQAIPFALAAVKATSSIMGGYSEQARLKAQAREYSNQARDVDLQAVQDSARRREQLNSSLATLSNTFASRNVGGNSPTNAAIVQTVTNDAYRGEGIAELGYRRQAGTYRRQSEQLRRSGNMAVTQGYLGAAGEALSAFGSAKSLFKGGGGKNYTVSRD